VAITVTATASGAGSANGIECSVRVLNNAAHTQNGSASNSETVTTPKQAITPSKSGSLVYGVVQHRASTTSFTTTNAITSLANSTVVTGTRWGMYRSSAATTTSSTTYGWNTPTGTSGQLYLAQAEILGFPVTGAGSLAEDASTPAVASTSSAKTVTSASFTPPTSGILVALVSNQWSGSGAVSVAVTDSTAGGYSWAQLSGTGTTNLCSVWVGIPNYPLMETLHETFPGSSLSGSWASLGTVTVSGNAASVQNDVAYDSGLQSAGLYNFYGSHVIAKVTGDTQSWIQVSPWTTAGGQNTVEAIGLLISDGTLNANWSDGNADFSTVASIAYDATAMAWLRIREAAGTVTFEYGPDGANWTVLGTVADPLQLFAVVLQMGAGGASPTSATAFANINTTVYAKTGAGMSSGSGTATMTPPTGMIKVTVTGGGTNVINGAGIAVRVLQNAARTAGAVNTTTSATTPQLAITPGATGSLVYGSVADGAGSGQISTALASTTSLAVNNDTVQGVTAAAIKSASTTTGGTPVTLGYSGLTSAAGSIFVALAEIPASGGTISEHSSTPPTAYNMTGKTVSSPWFHPPTGAVLVASVTTDWDGVTGTVTTAVADSAGAYTWAQAVGIATTDIASVWIGSPASTTYTKAGGGLSSGGMGVAGRTVTHQKTGAGLSSGTGTGAVEHDRPKAGGALSSAGLGTGTRTVAHAKPGGGLSSGAGTGTESRSNPKTGGGLTAGFGTGARTRSRVKAGGALSTGGLGTGSKAVTHPKAGGALSAGMGTGLAEHDLPKSGAALSSGMGTGTRTSTHAKTGAGLSSGMGTGTQETDRIKHGGALTLGAGTGARVHEQPKTGAGMAPGAGTGSHTRDHDRSGGAVTRAAGTGTRVTIHAKTSGGLAKGTGTGTELVQPPGASIKQGGGLAPAAGTANRVTLHAKAGGGLAPGAGTGAKLFITFTKAGGGLPAGLGSGTKSVVHPRSGGGLTPGIASGSRSRNLPRAGGALTPGAGTGAAGQVALVKAGAGLAPATGTGQLVLVLHRVLVKAGGGLATSSGTAHRVHIRSLAGGALAPATGVGVPLHSQELVKLGGGLVLTTGAGHRPARVAHVTAGPPHGRWSALEPRGRYSADSPHGRWSAGAPHG